MKTWLIVILCLMGSFALRAQDDSRHSEQSEESQTITDAQVFEEMKTFVPYAVVVLLTLGSFALSAQDDRGAQNDVITDDKILEEMNTYLTRLNGDTDSEEKRAEQIVTVRKAMGLWRSAEFRRLRDLPLMYVVDMEQKSPFYLTAIAFHNEEIADYADYEPVHDIAPELSQNFIRRAVEFRKSLKEIWNFSKVATLIDTEPALNEALKNPKLKSWDQRVLAIEPNLRFFIFKESKTLIDPESASNFRSSTDYSIMPVNGGMPEPFLHEDISHTAPSVTFSPDGSLMAILNDMSQLYIFDTQSITPKLIYSIQDENFHGKLTRPLIDHNNENILLLYDTQSDGMEISFFNIKLRKIIHTETQLSAAQSKAGRLDPVLSFIKGRAELNPTKLELAQTTENGILFTDFTPIFETPPGPAIHTLHPYEKSALALSFENDGKLIEIYNFDGIDHGNFGMTLHELPSFKTITDIPLPNERSLLGSPWKFEPHKHLFYILTNSSSLTAYNIDNGTPVRRQDLTSEVSMNRSYSQSIYLSKDGTKLLLNQESGLAETLDLLQNSKPDLGLLYLVDPDKLSQPVGGRR